MTARSGTPGPLRTLLIENDPADAELCIATLEQAGFRLHVEVIATRNQLPAALAGDPWDLVLADFRLPGWTGMEAFAEARRVDPDVPFILVTGTVGEERAVDCLKQGVDDYVLKGNLARLPHAVRRAIDDRNARHERARTEALVARLKLAVDQSPASVMITDTTGRIEYVNEQFSRTTGYRPDEALGRNPSFLQSGETPRATYEDLWRTILGGGIWSGEIRNRRRNGQLYWESVRIAPVRDSGGAITHFVATQEDVTERRAVERALRESEERFRKLTEASFDGIDIVQDGVIREANDGFARMFGYSVAEVIGRPVLDFVAEESRDDVARRVRDGIDGPFEAVGLTRDGRRLQLELTARSHLIDGRPGRITAVRDVSARRSLEEQFRQAQKMEAVGRLAGGVAHDFNNLLTVITSYAELVLESLPDGDMRREDTQQICKAAEDAAGLTRQLLAFSRQQVIQPQVVALEDVVSSARKLLDRVIGEDIEVQAVLHDAPTMVKVDAGQLEQAIANLVVNARDAMPTGGKLTIATDVTELDQEYAGGHWPVVPGRYGVLSISDTGVGMDEATKARIFEPFFTTKEVGRGTGLGLSSVYGFVKQSGGFIWVYSEPGAGTTFKIYLPIDGVEPGPPDLAPALAGVPHGTETILLVEDADSVRGAVRVMLERFGYTVLEASSGDEALARARLAGTGIDLLLTDVVMPRMSGRRLAEQFIALHPSARVLYMSGYTDDAIVRHGVLGPGVAFMQKPFSAETLARKVRQVLDGAKDRDAPARA